VALCHTLFDVLHERRDILLGGVNKERLQADVGPSVIGQAQLIQNAQLIVVFEDGGRLARRAAQRLLLLYVVGKLTKCLPDAISLRNTKSRAHVQTRPSAALLGSVWARVVRSWWWCGVADAASSGSFS
jgi:hypothetical protein